ncbi:hypothetical protein Tco_0383288 [Tanacetum coccineum]
MVNQGLNFSGHVTPLFPNMLVQAVVDEGEVLRDSLEGTNGCKGDQLQSSNDKPHSGGNISKRAEGGLNLQVLHNTCTLLSQQVLDLQKAKDTRAAEIFKLKKRIKKLEKKCKPSITHHKAWLRSVSRLSMKKMLDLDADLAHGMDYMETEEAVNEGRQSNEIEELNLDVDTKVIAEDQGSGEKGGSTVSTARPKVDTIRPNVDAARQEVSAIEPRTLPTTTSIFDDEDITMAQTLINMKEEKAKEKGVAFKDVEDSSRPARSVLTLKPLPSIDPKDKGNGILVEEEPIKIKRKDQGIYHIKRDEELAHKLHEEELAEIARIQDEKAAQEEASRVAIIEMFDEVQAAAQRKFRAVQRAAEIRSRPPTKSQLRNLMMTYLKNMVGYKHFQLKSKTFEEIQAMYERQKKIIYDFKPMDSDDAVKDSKKAGGEDTSKEEEVLKEPNKTRVEVKLKAAEQGTKITPGKTVKLKARKKGRKQTHADTDAEHDSEEDERKTESMNKEDAVESTKKDEEGIIDFEVLEKSFPIINWESKFYHFDKHGAECIYYRIFRSDGSSRWINTFFKMVTRFDRLDLMELYNLVMQSWDFYENYGVHTLTLEDGTEIHMLAERKYLLTKETLERMMSLKLIVESASDYAHDLLRFIQKKIDEAGSHDGGEKDL